MGKTRNTGFSSNAIQFNSGSIAFVSGSTTLLNISSSGNIVTTGTITANTLVIQTVTSSVSFVTGSTKFGSINSNTHQFTGSLLVSGSSTALNINNGALFVSSSGFIGIGVTGSTTPVRLSVSGAIESLTDSGGEGGQITLRGTTFQYGIDNFNGNNLRIIRENDGTGAAGVVLMNISASGNVGIGTTTPSSLLDVNGNLNVSAAGNIFTATTSGIFFNGAGSFAVGIYNDNSGVLRFQTNSTERMRITSGGAINIKDGTLTGGGGFEFTSEAFFGARFQSNAYKFMAGNNSTQLLQIDSLGCLIISGNGNGFTIGQASGVNRIDNTGSTFRCLGTGNGFTAIAASAFNVNSDYRLKEDLKDFNNALNVVDSIKIYDFKWKDREERNYGVIAHELQEVLPYIVYGEKDGTSENGEAITQGVDYGKIVPILTKAIQELKAENDALKTRIETLENK